MELANAQENTANTCDNYFEAEWADVEKRKVHKKITCNKRYVSLFCSEWYDLDVLVISWSVINESQALQFNSETIAALGTCTARFWREGALISPWRWRTRWFTEPESDRLLLVQIELQKTDATGQQSSCPLSSSTSLPWEPRWRCNGRLRVMRANLLRPLASRFRHRRASLCDGMVYNAERVGRD